MRKAEASPATSLAARVVAGEPVALARAISIVENGRAGADELMAGVRQNATGILSIGVTGPPGVGKSTLVSALIRALRAGGRRVAVIAVDPSSPTTGGAILGDRTRMGEHSLDAGVFIRSLSNRGHLGGISTAVYDIIDLVDAAEWDVVIVETVGAGQSETEIAGVADVRIVVMAPGLGDDVQAIKAGILEIADLLVVNKADRDGADVTKRHLEGMLGLRSESARRVQVVKTVATDNRGVDELLALIEGHASVGNQELRRRKRAERLRGAIAANASERVRRAILGADAAELESELAKVLDGKRSIRSVIPEVLQKIMPSAFSAGAEERVEELVGGKRGAG